MVQAIRNRMFWWLLRRCLTRIKWLQLLQQVVRIFLQLVQLHQLAGRLLNCVVIGMHTGGSQRFIVVSDVRIEIVINGLGTATLTICPMAKLRGHKISQVLLVLLVELNLYRLPKWFSWKVKLPLRNSTENGILFGIRFLSISIAPFLLIGNDVSEPFSWLFGLQFKHLQLANLHTCLLNCIDGKLHWLGKGSGGNLWFYS